MRVRATLLVLIGVNVLLLVLGFYTLAKNRRLLDENAAQAERLKASIAEYHKAACALSAISAKLSGVPDIPVCSTIDGKVDCVDQRDCGTGL